MDKSFEKWFRGIGLGLAAGTTAAFISSGTGYVDPTLLAFFSQAVVATQ